MPAPFMPSDQEMWLLWLASEYVLATRDLAFLDEEVPTYPVYGVDAELVRVRKLLHRCYTHLVEQTGTGKHGLQRLSNGDWNDDVVLGYVPEEQRDEVAKVGESVLNAAMASYALEIYARLLRYAKEERLAVDAMKWSQAQREAVQKQWTGKWFKRAWLNEELGWIGEDILWLEPQPWAIIGGAADPEQVETLVKSLEEEVRQPSKLGAILLSKPVERKEGPPGTGTNAGIWPSINGTLIWALALANGKMAWDEWTRNTLAMHAETYPEIWYGIWSGPDCINSELADKPGETGLEFLGVKWTDFPVMNMHPHAWPLYTITKLLGVEFSSDGIDFAPTLPLKAYWFSSPLLEFERTEEGYSGRYAPITAGIWRITLKLEEKELQRISRVEINGSEEAVAREGNRIVFSGKSTPDKPLRWVLSY
jgi:hypothetical protein